MAQRVSVEDLALAAAWLREYNDGQVEDARGYDETAATMFKVAAWLEAEVARREEEQAVRLIVTRVEAETGKKADSQKVRALVRRHASKSREG